MRKLNVNDLVEPIAEACVRASRELPAEVLAALVHARDKERTPLAREVLSSLIENACIACREDLPLCQDTGALVVFAELGQELCLTGGEFAEAIDRGVARGCEEGYLRASMLQDPLRRGPNTGNNTPAVLHTRVVPGDRLRLHLAPKGGGSENMSALWMLNPSDGAEGVVRAVVERVQEAQGKPCPPLVLGVGVGGTFEKAALMAKEALLRPLGQPNPDAELAALEARLLREVNATGVGPMGLGGCTTALAVHLLTYPCHIASLPVALNVQCHAARHVTLEF